MEKFDVAILGSGPGGYVCALRAAQYGLKTALIEENELGGTCLNRGCIPTKAMIHCAELFHDFQKAGKFGIVMGDISYDFAVIAARRDKLVTQLRKGIANLEKANGVTVIHGRGVLTSPRTIAVEGETVEADRLVLATGSSPAIPLITGMNGPNVLTSDDVLRMTELPESVVIVGGGVIGIEFAFLFAALGKEVTVLEMAPSVLNGVEEEIVRLLLRKFRRLKIQVQTGVRVTRILGEEDATVEFESEGKKNKVTAQKCVVCVGRRPNTDRLGLEELGIATKNGFVIVDDQLRTNLPGVIAIGDITGKLQLAHVASAQGKVAAAVCAGRPASIRYDRIPACVYTSPEIAWVGMTEKNAKDSGRSVRTGEFHIPASGRALVMGADTGIVRLIVDSETEEILGGQIFGPRATDMISEIATVMNHGGTIREIAETVHPHPTLSETIMEAAEDVFGLCCHQAPKNEEGK